MKGKRSARERLIVALDCPTQSMALNLVNTLGDDVTFYKVGWRLFLQGGLAIVEEIRSQGKDVFLDLKMDDIPETIQTAVQEIADQAMFLTIFGNAATVRAAIAGRGQHTHPKLLQVTVLSSMDQQDLVDAYGDGVPCLEDFVILRAGKSIEAGCDGLIAAGQSIKALRARYGPDPIIVTPGIRPSGSSIDDQKRALTPAEAITLGADYLVVGRPVHASPDPVGAVAGILSDMESALAGL